MKTVLICLAGVFIPSLTSLGEPSKNQGAPTAGEAIPGPEALARQTEKLAAAAGIGREWQDHLMAGTMDKGMGLWGYTAFQGTTPETFQARLAIQTSPLGRLLYTGLLEDRCLIDVGGSSPERESHPPGVYVTLRYISEYEKGTRRESLALHEPAKGGGGLKIIGLRREALPAGRVGAFELAATLGQLALLKLHQAPVERWAPYQREAAALAGNLNLKLPAIPDSGDSGDKSAGEKLVNFVMLEIPPLFEKLGVSGGAVEAKAALNAFAVLMLYVPGEETTTRLAVLAGSEAEKARLPAELWKPLIKAVSDKAKLPIVHEAVQRMVAGVSAYLADQQTAADLKQAPREILDRALMNMAQLPTYKVRAELSAADGRHSYMDAVLGPGTMDLTMQGFDGRRERRVVSEKGYRISLDEGKTWEEEKDPEVVIGLCRTLQSPLDLSLKTTEKHVFTFVGEEKIENEQLFRFESDASAGQAPLTYWVLMSRSGPVIRRARKTMTFGTLESDALFIYTGLGKPVEIPDVESGGQKPAR